MESEPGRGTFERLWRLGDELGNRPVLVTTDDLGALFVDQYADDLAEVFRFPRQPRGLATQLADKADLFQLCLDTGIPTPHCVTLGRGVTWRSTSTPAGRSPSS